MKLANGDVDGANAALDQQNALGKLFPVFVQSFRGDDVKPPVYFHPQLIADSRTVLEILRFVSPVKLPDLEMQLEYLQRLDRRSES
jgi:hypothetical protein